MGSSCSLARARLDMARLLQKVRLDTNVLDGLRGFAVFHIILGHLFLFSEWPQANEAQARRLQAGACPEGALRIGSSCYYSDCKIWKEQWAEAERSCGLTGGHLFSPSSAELLRDVTRAFFEETDELQWLGVSLKSGTWSLATGGALLGGAESELWHEGEPNNFDGIETVSAVDTEGRSIYDVPPKMWPMRFICQVEADMSRCAAPCPARDSSQRPCAKEAAPWRESLVCHESQRPYLMGGGSMGLFYIISGFVMAIGLALRP